MSLSVSAAEITSMRGDLVALSYQDLAEIRRSLPPAQRRDRGGGSTVVGEPPTVAIVPCRIARGNQPITERALTAGLTGVASVTFYTPPPAVDPNYRILSGDQAIITSAVDADEPPLHLQVTGAEVRRTINLEQVVACIKLGDEPPPPSAQLQT